MVMIMFVRMPMGMAVIVPVSMVVSMKPFARPVAKLLQNG